MDETSLKDRFRRLERQVSELLSEISRIPVRLAKVRTTSVTVYELVSCDDPTLRIYADNESIAQHLPGASGGSLPVALLRVDGSLSCWRAVGPAAACKTGVCVEIVAWTASCAACAGPCWLLTPCGGGSPTVVQGEGWVEYLGRVVKIVGDCYTVTLAEACVAVNDEITVDDVQASYLTCEKCDQCYELTPCDDSGEAVVIYVGNDLAEHAGVASGEDVVGQIWSLDGTCYEVTDFQSPCTETAEFFPFYDLFGFGTVAGGLRRELNCNACCYRLTPCSGQVDSTVIEVVPDAGDPDLWEFVEHTLSSCGDGCEHYASNGRVLRLSNGTCYEVTKPTSPLCDEPVLGLGTVLEIYEPGDGLDGCAYCIRTVWKLCESPFTQITTYSDLREFDANGMGPPFDCDLILRRAEDGLCYEFVELAAKGGTGVPFTVEAAYPSCEICLDARIKLTPACGAGCDCSSGGTSTDTTHDPIVLLDEHATGLADHVGHYVKIEGVCYFVEWSADEATTTDQPCFYGPYGDCEACRGGASAITLPVMKIDGTIVGMRIEGPFNVCVESEITEPCEEA